MDTLLDVGQALSTMVLLLAPVAVAVLFFVGRKYFDPKGSAGGVSDELEKTEHRIRDHFHSVVGNMENTATQRHEQLTRDLRDVKEDMRSALARANEAHDRANEALAQANRAWDGVKAVDKRLEDQYSLMRSSLERIEKSIQAMRENHG